jgi:hypothetical protein
VIFTGDVTLEEGRGGRVAQLMPPAAGSNGVPVVQCLGRGITASQVSAVLGGSGQEPPETGVVAGVGASCARW